MIKGMIIGLQNKSEFKYITNQIDNINQNFYKEIVKYGKI